MKDHWKLVRKQQLDVTSGIKEPCQSPDYSSRSPPPSRDAILSLINQEEYIPPSTAVALPQGRAEKIKILSDMWRDTPATAKEKTRARAAARKKRKAGPIGSAYKIPRNLIESSENLMESNGIE